MALGTMPVSKAANTTRGAYRFGAYKYGSEGSFYRPKGRGYEAITNVAASYSDSDVITVESM